MSVPAWVPDGHHDLWLKPWTVELDPRKHRTFKRRCWEHGYLAPHFLRSEAASHGSDGTVQVPEKHRIGAQQHAFSLERARHRLGRPLSDIDWYRTEHHNAEVGGATNSEHVVADATDWGAQPEQARFNDVMRSVFSEGGIGSGAVSGRVMHVDNGRRNGGPRRWTYPGS